MDHFEVNAYFFNGHNFMSSRGLPLYTSYKESGNSYIPGGINNIIGIKTGYRTAIAGKSFLFLRFEGFYHAGFKQFDYTFGIHLQVNDLVRIASLNR